MKSKLIPGKIRPISFLLVIPIILIGLLIGQISFNLLVDYRLHQLETQISPVEVTESSYAEENAEVEQMFDNDNIPLESVNRGSVDRDFKSLGMFEITYYCPCEKCCGKSDGVTRTGTHAAPNRTIAVDPDVIPLGTKVMVDGVLYTAEDTGNAIQGNRIDIFVESHEDALQLGRHQAEVFVY